MADARDRMRAECEQHPRGGYMRVGKIELARILDALEAARKLADSKLIRTLEKLVAGWQRDPKSPRHPDKLGCNPRTNAGAIYEITDLAAAFRAADRAPKAQSETREG